MCPSSGTGGVSAYWDDAFVLLICFYFFHLYKPLRHSQSVDHLNSKICTICRAQLIATPSFCLPQKQSMKRDTGSRLYCLSWILSTGIVTCISRAFSARFFSVQILKNSSRLHSKLILLPLSSVTYSSLFFGLFVACMLVCRCLQMEWRAAVTGVCSMHAVMQVPLDRVMSSRNWCCNPFAACTADVTVSFNR